MTQLLEQAVQTLRGLPPETQDALARILLQLAGDDQSIVRLSAEEEASFEASLAQAERREFATDDQIKAIWAKHGLRSCDTRFALRHQALGGDLSKVLLPFTSKDREEQG